MRVVPAQATEHAAALELLFEHLPVETVGSRMRAASGLLTESNALLLVARQEGRMVGAVLGQVLPGATGVLWPPRAASGTPRSDRVEDALLHEALAALRRHGALLVQAILSHAEAHLAAPLLRGGFTRPTELHYLQRTPQRIIGELSGAFDTYAPSEPAEFHETLLHSYIGSLDFPEVDGLRPLAEVVRGYQAIGYDPSRWWLMRVAGKPVGVLLLSESEREVWELTYVGVVPEARRRGHGRDLVRKALGEACAAGVTTLTVCVDGRNAPALRLYTELGFQEFDRRDVFLNCSLSREGS